MIKSTRQVGRAIRDLRKQQHLTGEDLGRRVGISQSKISKIENGFYARLQKDEIEKILNILHTPSSIRQQIAVVVNDPGYKVHTHLPFGFNDSSVKACAELERDARLIRIHTLRAVPALLQTPDYRMALLRYNGISEDEVGLNMKHTIMRQDLLWDNKHQFHIIIPVASLYTMAASKQVQRTQIDRLERMVQAPTVKLGIIPVEAGLTLYDIGSFALYDDRVLVQSIARGDVINRNEAEIDHILQVFDALDKLAYYDDEAVQLIRKVAMYFT
jgi:transcriptional regulator with XRE-family HTH domain